MALELASPTFTHEGEIPAPYTCDGETVLLLPHSTLTMRKIGRLR
jgi:hypothetical protein